MSKHNTNHRAASTPPVAPIVIPPVQPTEPGAKKAPTIIEKEVEGPVKREVVLGKKLFQFDTSEQWNGSDDNDSAERHFQRAGITTADVLCLDADGRICRTVNVTHQFPITVYALE